jgi:hypothetical protein
MMRLGALFVDRGLVVAVVAVFAGATGLAQRGQRAEAPPLSPRVAAPVDLTGYWVAVVTEDWRWRMVTPARGDYASVPLNGEGRRAAAEWNPKKDEAAGEQCRSYGAAAIMRVPGRLHITWENDSTLRLDLEAGTQTRFFRFGQPDADSDRPSWQGRSSVQWEMSGGGGRMFGAGRAKPSGGLKVTTTGMRAGYLRRNGVPYSANAVVTEYVNALRPEENGDRWLVVTTVVQDPQYLTGRFITSSHFKKLPDGSAWHPTACRAS